MIERLLNDVARLPEGTLRRGLIASLFMLVIYVLNGIQIFQFISVRDDSILQDYWAFHAGAKAAADGSVAFLYEAEKFQDVFGVYTGLLWLYPPTILLFLEPLANLPYGAFKYVLIVMNVVAAAYAVYLCYKNNIAIILLMLISPAFYAVLYTGQLSAIYAMLLLVGLSQAKTRPIIAGICIGLLTVKPQLGILVPFYLIFIGAWRTFFVAALVAILLIVASVSAFGMEPWIAFGESLTGTHLEFSQRMGVIGRITLGDALRGVGVSSDTSLMFSVLALVASVYMIFRASRSGVSSRVLIALTMMLTALSAPYFWVYDWIFMSLGTLLFLRELGSRAPKHIQLLVLFIWYAPLLPYVGSGIIPFDPIIWVVSVIATGILYIEVLKTVGSANAGQLPLTARFQQV